jgi:hypothetical protein
MAVQIDLTNRQCIFADNQTRSIAQKHKELRQMTSLMNLEMALVMQDDIYIRKCAGRLDDHGITAAMQSNRTGRLRGEGLIYPKVVLRLIADNR